MCLDTKLWDVAAGLLIAEEAGIVLSDFAATPDRILAAAPGVWSDLLNLLG